MGADIHGWVEVPIEGTDQWAAAFEVGYVDRAYGMFASLFGVRNGAERRASEEGRFRAIAAARGEPPDASVAYLQDRDANGGVGETWVLWSELAAVDWDEEGEEIIWEQPPRGWEYADPEDGWRHERRRDFLWGSWTTLFERMATLAERFGAENVRLAVWFDQW